MGPTHDRHISDRRWNTAHINNSFWRDLFLSVNFHGKMLKVGMYVWIIVVPQWVSHEIKCQSCCVLCSSMTDLQNQNWQDKRPQWQPLTVLSHTVQTLTYEYYKSRNHSLRYDTGCPSVSASSWSTVFSGSGGDCVSKENIESQGQFSDGARLT